MSKQPTLTCLNCDHPLSIPKRPYLYCSVLCKQEAKYVRYKRAKIAEGVVNRPDIKEALNYKFAFILGGGYPEGERRLKASERAAVFARDGGRCRACGGVATVIDHIGASGPEGDINHPANLQSLCERCHNEKTQRSLRVVTPESDPEEFRRCEEKWLELESRVRAPEPMRKCDDEVGWETVWRVVARERAAIVADRLGSAPCDHKSNP